MHAIYILYIAPSGPPTNLAVNVTSSTTVSLSWNPPPESDKNGLIIEYNVSLIDTMSGNHFFRSTSSNHLTVEQLYPNTIYQYAVAAITSVGSGPFTKYFYFKTSEAGMHDIIKIIFSYMI